MQDFLKFYGIKPDEFTIAPLGNGLINNTRIVKMCNEDKSYVLQKINTNVFKVPENIACNIELISTFLQKNNPNYFFAAPIKTIDGKQMVNTIDGYYRLFPFVKESYTIDVATTPEQAYEASKQFAKFTKELIGFDASSLKITLPDFHNLSLRFKQFELALITGNKERIEDVKKLSKYLLEQKNIVDEFKKLKNDFRVRVAHHDTKISNVLFYKEDKGLCVIDLDTIMPGYFISDVGDMMRTYLCPVSEEESDFTKIEIRLAFYKAIVEGYKSEMGEELTEAEMQSFLFAGKYMIYMQALRFLTDYIMNDVYYGCKYPKHNLVRAGNQAELLKRLQEFTP
ncbi:MAG: phosphotransferase [Chitinophagaceae bacterium]|nr:phosphotransferase [Chitinophagaceae bacterium]